jgi:tetrahydromethanopterin S-methyltransferase subunit A
MTPEESLQTIRAALDAGIVLSKCQKCGCMDSALKHFAAMLPHVGTEEALDLAASVAASRKNMHPVQYACLGCAYCYPAVAQNAFAQAFPALSHAADVDCAFHVREAG